MENKIKAMEDMFDKWYSTLNETQRVDLQKFSKEYPLRCLEENIFSHAEINDIEVDVPPTVLSEIKISEGEYKRAEIIKCEFIPLINLNKFSDKSIKERIDESLLNLFSDKRNEHATKKIVFYCMLPMISKKGGDEYFGVFGTFFVGDPSIIIEKNF